jgi:hypothetical protein
VEGPVENAPLHARIAELERLVGRLMLENELLKKVIPNQIGPMYVVL